MSVYGVRDVLVVGDVASETGFPAIDLPSSQLGWLVGKADIVALASMAGCILKGDGFRVSIPRVLGFQVRLELSPGLVGEIVGDDVAVIRAQAPVQCPSIQFIYDVPDRVLLATDACHWLQVVLPEFRIQAVMSLGLNPSLDELVALPQRMFLPVKQLSDMRYCLQDGFLRPDSVGISLLDYFSAYAGRAYVLPGSIADVCSRVSYRLLDRPKYGVRLASSLVPKKIRRVELSVGPWQVVASQNREFCVAEGPPIQQGELVEFVVPEGSHLSVLQMNVSADFDVFKDGQKQGLQADYISGEAYVLQSHVSVTGLILTFQTDLDVRRPRWADPVLTDYVSDGEFVAGYCYLSMILPSLRGKVLSTLGSWPKLMHILLQPSDAFLAASDLNMLYLREVTKARFHVQVAGAVTIMPAVAYAVQQSNVDFPVGTFGQFVKSFRPVIFDTFGLASRLGALETLVQHDVERSDDALARLKEKIGEVGSLVDDRRDKVVQLEHAVDTLRVDQATCGALVQQQLEIGRKQEVVRARIDRVEKHVLDLREKLALADSRLVELIADMANIADSGSLVVEPG